MRQVQNYTLFDFMCVCVFVCVLTSRLPSELFVFRCA